MSQAPSISVQRHDPDAENHAAIKTVLEYWCSLNGGDTPRRSDFEFMDIYRVAPQLMMSERVAAKTFSFIYCGTGVADNSPLDLTGKTFGPDSVEASRIPWFDYKSTVLDGPCIRFGRDVLDWPNYDFDTIFSGIFPLDDAAGNHRFVLACLVFLKTGT